MSAATMVTPKASWREWTAAVVAWRPVLGTEALILIGTLYFVAFANIAFWRAAVPDPVRPTWVLSLFLLLVAVHGIALSALVWRRTARVVLSALILVSAFACHYMAAYGIYIDADMIRNVLNTDWHEARDLMGIDALWPMLAAMPAILMLWRVRVRPSSWRRAALARMVFLLLMLLIGVVGALPSLQPLTSFLRNQREARYLVTPANVLVSLARVATDAPGGRVDAQLPIAEDAVQMPAAMRRPRLLVLVVGETARAANWGLNGYARQTTPELAARGVINFPRVGACGSSTEVSLPCMFSPYGRANYDEDAIRGHQSLLHVLQHAGIAILWRDNQSGCKGVCNGLPFEDMTGSANTALCRDGRCLDAVLLEGLHDAAERRPGDQVIVLHMLGNHGPTYFERYPEAFRRFTPVCETSDLGRCDRQQIVNAYDNALLYTDHVLATAIDRLKTLPGYDSALLYVSDHGESLGENGLYLHGMPYAIAPDEQLHVPMIAWFSEAWRGSMQFDPACLQRQATRSYSHDNLFHTVLGLFDVRTTSLDPRRDIFATCRPAQASSDRS